MADEIKKEEVKETKVEAKVETKVEEPKTIKIRGIEVPIEEAEILIVKGAEAMQAEKNKKPEKTKDEEVEKPDPNEERIKKLEQEVNAEKAIRNKREITETLDRLGSSFDLTKNDDDTRAIIENLVLLEAQKAINAKKSLSDIYKEQVKIFGDKFAKKKSEYLKDKVNTAKETKTNNSGSSTSSIEEVKIDGNELKNGKLRDRIKAKLRKGAYN